MSKPTRKTNTITVHCNVKNDVLDVFDRLYPACRTRFINNAMLIATNNKNFFDKIFFKDIITDNDFVHPV